MESYAAIFCLGFVLLQAVVNAAEESSQTDKMSTRFTITLPPECNKNELCTVRPIDYPTKTMDRIAKRLIRRLRRHSPNLSVTASTPEGFNNCVEKREQLVPYIIVTNNTQKYVIQSHRFYNQTMTVVKCRTEDAPCFPSLGNHPSGRPRFICKTNTNIFNLKMYNFELKKLESVNYYVPVDCTCSTTEDDDVLN